MLEEGHSSSTVNFHTLLLLCPSQLYVILPQLYSISCSWEEMVCVEYGRLAEAEPPLSQLWGSCHPCWVRLLTGAVDLGSLTLVAVTLYRCSLSRPNKPVGLPRWALGQFCFGLPLVPSLGKVDACSSFLRKKAINIFVLKTTL